MLTSTRLFASTGFALVNLALILMLCFVGPSLSSWQPEDIDWQSIQTGPSAQHWFGTDLIGRDFFVRPLKGARTSLFIALSQPCQRDDRGAGAL
ncbi:MAG: hypothetical protein CM15mP120_11020 [Pseudomonadota bacterium]|nr:MAG: hypothetical protein CM15mP120_11020 [Pseudomonadota bacterium]